MRESLARERAKYERELVAHERQNVDARDRTKHETGLTQVEGDRAIA